MKGVVIFLEIKMMLEACALPAGYVELWKHQASREVSTDALIAWYNVICTCCSYRKQLQACINIWFQLFLSQLTSPAPQQFHIIIKKEGGYYSLVELHCADSTNCVEKKITKKKYICEKSTIHHNAPNIWLL